MSTLVSSARRWTSGRSERLWCSPSFPAHRRGCGPVPVRAYALCIIAGILTAVWLTRRRWAQAGGDPDVVIDIAVWAVPFGIVGGRLYHVITDPEFYFTPGHDPWAAFYIWDGGLGIWAAVALGAVGAWIACRRHRVSLLAFADALAPGLALAQAVGRWGNWFTRSSTARPAPLPWALQIDPAHPPDTPLVATYQPTSALPCARRGHRPHRGLACRYPDRGLAMRFRADIDAFVSAFTGSHRLVVAMKERSDSAPVGVRCPTRAVRSGSRGRPERPRWCRPPRPPRGLERMTAFWCAARTESMLSGGPAQPARRWCRRRRHQVTQQVDARLAAGATPRFRQHPRRRKRAADRGSNCDHDFAADSAVL
jgi:hypothetical protein